MTDFCKQQVQQQQQQQQQWQWIGAQQRYIDETRTLNTVQVTKTKHRDRLTPDSDTASVSSQLTFTPWL
jgi:hypothetical protein